jgi:tetratricopeptide (TPR) repeat protein
MMLRKTLRSTAIFLLAIVSSGLVHARQGSSYDELKRLTAQLQQNPSDDALREQVIKLAAGLDMMPAAPPQVDELSGQAKFILGHATSLADFSNAADAYVKASLLAPWVADNYLNAAVSFEKANRYADALRFYQFYLLAAPDAPDAKSAREHIGGLKYAIQKDASDRAAADVAVHQKEQAIRGLNGFWACQSGCNGWATVNATDTTFSAWAGGRNFSGTLDKLHISGTSNQEGFKDSNSGCTIPDTSHAMTGTIREDGKSIILKSETTTYYWHGTLQGGLVFGSYQCDGVNPTNVGPLEIVLVGGATRPSIGLVLTDLTPDAAAKLPAQSSKDYEKQVRACGKEGQAAAGALVQQVLSGSTAGDAGIAVGDIVVDQRGFRVCRASDLLHAVSNISPGGAIQLRVLRANGKTEKTDVQIGGQSVREPELTAGTPSAVVDQPSLAPTKPLKR